MPPQHPWTPLYYIVCPMWPFKHPPMPRVRTLLCFSFFCFIPVHSLTACVMYRGAIVQWCCMYVDVLVACCVPVLHGCNPRKPATHHNENSHYMCTADPLSPPLHLSPGRRRNDHESCAHAGTCARAPGSRGQACAGDALEGDALNSTKPPHTREPVAVLCKLYLSLIHISEPTRPY